MFSQQANRIPIQEKPLDTLGDVFCTPVGDQSGADATSWPTGFRRGRKAPALAAVQLAIRDIHTLLHPKRRIGYGHRMHGLRPFIAQHLQEMLVFLRLYVHGAQCGEWMKSSLTAAKTLGRGGYYAQRLRHWSVGFILN